MPLVNFFGIKFRISEFYNFSIIFHIDIHILTMQMPRNGESNAFVSMNTFLNANKCIFLIFYSRNTAYIGRCAAIKSAFMFWNWIPKNIR